MQLDGINLSLREASPYTVEFIKEISSVMGKRGSKRFMLTATPVCHSEASYAFKLETIVRRFDRIFIDLTVAGKCEQFKKNLLDDTWFQYARSNPSLKIWFVFSASLEAVGAYFNTEKIVNMFQVINGELSIP